MKLYFEDSSDRINKAVYNARKSAVGHEMLMGRFGRKCMNFAEQFLSDYDIDAKVEYLGYSYDHINRYVKNGDEIQFYKCKAEVPRREIIDKLFDGKELWERDSKVKEDPRYNIFSYKNHPADYEFYKISNGDEYMFVEVSPLAKDKMLALYFELWVRMDLDKAEFERDNDSKRYKRFYSEGYLNTEFKKYWKGPGHYETYAYRGQYTPNDEWEYGDNDEQYNDGYCRTFDDLVKLIRYIEDRGGDYIFSRAEKID